MRKFLLLASLLVTACTYIPRDITAEQEPQYRVDRSECRAIALQGVHDTATVADLAPFLFGAAGAGGAIGGAIVGGAAAGATVASPPNDPTATGSYREGDAHGNGTQRYYAFYRACMIERGYSGKTANWI